MFENTRHRTTSNEEIIREELRAISASFMTAWRSGITLMSSLIIALWYLRGEIRIHLNLKPGDLIPLDFYLFGTILLFIIATIFCGICRVIGKRYAFYAKALATECDNPIKLPPLTSGLIGRKLFLLIFFVFPLFDFAIRIYRNFEFWIK